MNVGDDERILKSCESRIRSSMSVHQSAIRFELSQLVFSSDASRPIRSPKCSTVVNSVASVGGYWLSRASLWIGCPRLPWIAGPGLALLDCRSLVLDL